MNSIDAKLIKNGTIGDEVVVTDHVQKQVCYICPHCNAILFVDKAKEVSGFKWCPNCGTKMQQKEAWNEEWTRQ